MANQQKYSKLGSKSSADAIDVGESPQPSDNDEFYYASPKRRSFCHTNFIAYTALILSNIVLFILWMKSSYLSSPTVSDANCVRPKLVFSAPAFNGAVTYERRRLFRHLNDNPFAGPPRPELDAAYEKILEPLTTKITNEEYEHLGATTLGLKDGSGYVGEMAVYHELHCIKRIRRHLNLNHYYPGLTGKELERENAHADHCLEYWREAAMCRADATMATMFWRDAVPTSRAWSDHECVNWELFDTWARSRTLNLTDPGILNETGRYDWISTPAGGTVLRENPEIEVFNP
ncbi:hypothetical protein DSL72_000237 [Monilinia vaccinii-corymbosi]|uniref:Tat pathway signal sequence n=1 Tax=Monilinia vaccinii-corymbosi TaxID=61207 RepID=A0A8A3P9E6_9HELO|nr:hypothetical protein DSL72_000237 [Monilinia vaccinii-corymbosi]